MGTTLNTYKFKLIDIVKTFANLKLKYRLILKLCFVFTFEFACSFKTAFALKVRVEKTHSKVNGQKKHSVVC